MRILAVARPGSFPCRDASELIARRGSFLSCCCSPPAPECFVRVKRALAYGDSFFPSFSLIVLSSRLSLARTTLHSAAVVGQPSALTPAPAG